MRPFVSPALTLTTTTPAAPRRVVSYVVFASLRLFPALLAAPFLIVPPQLLLPSPFGSLTTTTTITTTATTIAIAAASPNLIARFIPSFFLRWVLKTLLVRKFAATVPVAAKLERLGRMIDRHLPAAGAPMSGTGAGRHYTSPVPSSGTAADIIDLLKVDVEGAEIAVLEVG